MEPHQERVVEEKAELDTKIERLAAFFDSPIYKGVGSNEQRRLVHQLELMVGYSNVLGERISAF